MSLAQIILATLLVGWGLILRRKRLLHVRSKGFPYPPGPKQLPMIGNLLDIPQRHAWRKFWEWKGCYGDLVFVEALGNRILVLNTMEAANDLFVKRGTVYSDRPTLVMLGELMGVERSIPLLQYGPKLRQQRKLAHLAMGPESSKKFIKSQEDAVAIFMDSILHNSKDFYEQSRLASGRIIISSIYGAPATTPIEVFLNDADKLMKFSSRAVLPGSFLVDLIPMLKYLPSWLPFNNIHKIAESGKALVDVTITKPYEFTKKQMKEGIDRPSFTTEFMRAYESEAGSIDAESDSTIKWAAGSMYAPGSETTFAVTLVFIHAMALFPGVQRKIQAEIEAVVGHDRLPTAMDRPKLPYLAAAMKETLRWKPVAPMGVPRITNADDFYNGYFIPAGTIVLPNLGAISKDEISGIPAEQFAPERFTTGDKLTDALDPYSYAFGIGRRECPGKYLADNSLFLIISWLMATVTISRAKDDQGMDKPLDPEYTAGLISFPEPFEVNFEHRYPELATVIKHHIAAIE